jgi:hypothetical protein
MIRKLGPSTRLPDGTYFAFGEFHKKYGQAIHVNGRHPNGDDENPDIEELPLKTINAAAPIQDSAVLIHGLLKLWGKEYGVLEV